MHPDLVIIEAYSDCSAGGVFTTNRFAAPPVQWCRSILPADDLRAIVVNSGNANACTGQEGHNDVRTVAKKAARLTGCAERQVAVASTGVIGKPLPMDKLIDGIDRAHAVLSNDDNAARMAETAIMTTDKTPKACAATVEQGEGAFCVGGMAKGSGMIAPNMATMLAFITTDAEIAPPLLQEILSESVSRSFNRITVDGDTSTNDSVLLLANGSSGIRIDDSEQGLRDAFQDALDQVMVYLARAIVRDGEGATKLIEVQVSGAGSDSDAEKVARAVASSPLVKCAMNGEDPNWGRIICAAGYSGAEFDPENLTLKLGEVTVFQDGMPTGHEAAGALAGDEIKIRINLGGGGHHATMWTCDLSEEYVKINAKYHT
jgi:glutamate N-acetyltransferase/amino-acid N-acetyltransferase